MPTTPPWETPEWRTKVADPIGDVVHYKFPAIPDETADQIVLTVINLLCDVLVKSEVPK